MKEQISANNAASPEHIEDPFFISDEPCTDAEKIRFGHEAYVKAIQDAVHTCPAPFVIGLYGKWGTGKTTVLERLRSTLHNQSYRGKRFRVCLFDAWKYSSEEASFRRQFLAELNGQLHLRWDLDKLLYEPQEEQFTRMLRRAGISDARRLVVLVDHLDRCAPDAAVAALRTIKTFLEHEGCIFVVACDEDALIRHLVDEGGYADKTDAKEFLRKFFQTTMRIELLRQDLRDFACELVEAANLQSDVARVVWAANPRDPRRIIQFLNRLSLVLYLVKARESSGRLSPGEVSSKQAYLAKILWLKERWPEFIEDCLIHPDLMGFATQAIGQPEVIDKHPILKRYFDGDAPTEYRRLHEFMESTLDIKVSGPRAFLSLQRSALEMGIADPVTFGDMLRLGLVDEVATQLSQVTDGVQLQNYEAIMSRTIEEELRRERLPEAIQACRVAIDCFELLPRPRRDLAGTVCRILAHPSSREAILTFKPSSLLQCIAEAPEPFGQRAMGRVIESLDIKSPQVAEFFKALAKHTPALNEEGYAGIANFLLATLEAVPGTALGYLTAIVPESSLADNLLRSKPDLLTEIAKGITGEDPQLADTMMLTLGNFKDHGTRMAMDQLSTSIVTLLTRSEGPPPEADRQRAFTGLENLRIENVSSQKIEDLHQAVDKTIQEVLGHEEKLDLLAHCLGMYPLVSEQRQQVTTDRVVGFSRLWPPDKLSLLRDVIYDDDAESIQVAFLNAVKDRIWDPRRPAQEIEQLLGVVSQIPGDAGAVALTDALEGMLRRPKMPMKELAARSVANYRDGLPRDTRDQLVKAIYAEYMAVPPPQGEPLLGPLLQLVDMRTPAELRNRLADPLKGQMGQPQPSVRKRAAQPSTNLRRKLSLSTRSNVAQHVTNRLYDLREQLTLDDRAVFDIALEEQDNNRIPRYTWELLGNTIESLLHSDHTPEIRGMACDLVHRFDKLPRQLHEGILEQLETIVKDNELPQELRDAASLAIDHITA